MAEHIALLDFGSNAVRFVHARLSSSGVRIIEESRVRARLASGERGSLCVDSIEQTLRGATRFLRRAEKQRAELRIMAVATASVRDAPNANALIKRLPTLGVSELRILSGIEEAQLGAEAALRVQPLKTGAIIDLGGGSMQWSTIRAGRAKHALSLPIGAARMTREFIHHDPPQARELKRLRDSLRERLSSDLPSMRPRGRLIVLGGTARALARRKLRVGQDRPPKNRATVLSLDELIRLRERLQVMTIAQRKRLRGMRPERADIVVAGAMVLEQVLEVSGYLELSISSASVREGVLWREARRLRRTRD